MGAFLTAMATSNKPTNRLPKAPAAQAPAAQAGAAQAGASALAEQPPRSVRLAVRLMYAGAVLSLLYLAVSLVTASEISKVLRTDHPTWSHTRIEADVHAQVVSTIVIWLITIGFWIVMARTNLAGRTWARLTATVLFAFSSLNFIEGFLGQSDLITKLVYAPLWLVGLAATLLLWRPDTTGYIQSGRRQP
jgi:hypothetical protein